jgi:hypothetical protein
LGETKDAAVEARNNGAQSDPFKVTEIAKPAMEPAPTKERVMSSFSYFHETPG